MLGTGIYTIREAARLAEVHPRTARAWFSGWPKSPAGALLRRDYEGIGDGNLLSFLDFVDLAVASQIRKAGVSMQNVRRVHAVLAQRFNTPHPFARKELFADDCGTLFVRAANEAGDEELVEALSNQHTIPSILLPFLQRLRYSMDTNLAREYGIAEGVLLDPQRRYGSPITVESGMPTTILANAYKANRGNAEAVAEWYRVSVPEVMSAVEFEMGPLRKSA